MGMLGGMLSMLLQAPIARADGGSGTGGAPLVSYAKDACAFVSGFVPHFQASDTSDKAMAIDAKNKVCGLSSGYSDQKMANAVNALYELAGSGELTDGERTKFIELAHNGRMFFMAVIGRSLGYEGGSGNDGRVITEINNFTKKAHEALSYISLGLKVPYGLRDVEQHVIGLTADVWRNTDSGTEEDLLSDVAVLHKFIRSEDIHKIPAVDQKTINDLYAQGSELLAEATNGKTTHAILMDSWQLHEERVCAFLKKQGVESTDLCVNGLPTVVPYGSEQVQRANGILKKIEDYAKFQSDSDTALNAINLVWGWGRDNAENDAKNIQDNVRELERTKLIAGIEKDSKGLLSAYVQVDALTKAMQISAMKESGRLDKRNQGAIVRVAAENVVADAERFSASLGNAAK